MLQNITSHLRERNSRKINLSRTGPCSYLKDSSNPESRRKGNSGFRMSWHKAKPCQVLFKFLKSNNSCIQLGLVGNFVWMKNTRKRDGRIDRIEEISLKLTSSAIEPNRKMKVAYWKASGEGKVPAFLLM